MHLKSGTDSSNNLGICFIPPELPTSDYRYLSNLLHYEKEIVPNEFKPDKEKLNKIYNDLKFVIDNYSRFLVVNKNVKMFKENFFNSFGLNEETVRTFK